MQKFINLLGSVARHGSATFDPAEYYGCDIAISRMIGRAYHVAQPRNRYYNYRIFIVTFYVK
jgi:fructosamine-3-kinase